MIIAAYNPKGGVGKTTTAVNVSAALADRGRTVLLVDLEADLNASISLGVRPSDSGASVAEVLMNEVSAQDVIRPATGIDHLFLLTGSQRLTLIDDVLRKVKQPERRLAEVLRPLARQFDHIVIDAPAGYSLLPLSVPHAAQHLVVPIRTDYLSLESLAQFLRWYRDRHAARRAAADVAGVLLTMVDYRRQATREIVDIIRMHNPRGVFRTEIPEDPRVAEAPSHGTPLVDYSRSRAAVAYRQFTSEMLRRIRRR